MARNNFGGFGGGANMQQLMRQAQKLQQQMTEAQENLDAAEYEAASGGGMVKVKVSGKRELTEIVIDPQVVDPDDIEMLQDLIMAAVNEAFRKGEETREAPMSKLTPGMGGRAVRHLRQSQPGKWADLRGARPAGCSRYGADARFSRPVSCAARHSFAHGRHWPR